MSDLTLFYTVGLPASGKSTKAREMVAESGGQLVEVSKDDLRVLPDAPTSRAKQERWVVARQDAIIAQALADGKSVVVHDTNFNPVHVRRFEKLSQKFSARLRKLDFTQVDVLECIRRDAARDRPVGESVIWSMWQQYLYVPPTSPPPNGLPDAVLVDIDGTLARRGDRSPFDWNKVALDTPIVHVVDLVRDLARSGTHIVYMSGRDAKCREATAAWLADNVGVDGPLLMRPSGDSRADSLVKAELFDSFVEGRYRVKFALDDRNSVVHMWRTKGIPVFQVDYGHF